MTRSSRALAPHRRASRGSSMAEFGLVLPVFLTMVFGTIQFGQTIWMFNTVAEAAREGARYAATHGTTATYPATAQTVTDTVKSRTSWLDTSKLDVTTTWTPDANPGSVVAVTVAYSVLPNMPFIPSHTIAFHSTSRMVISY